ALLPRKWVPAWRVQAERSALSPAPALRQSSLDLVRGSGGPLGAGASSSVRVALLPRRGKPAGSLHIGRSVLSPAPALRQSSLDLVRGSGGPLGAGSSSSVRFALLPRKWVPAWRVQAERSVLSSAPALRHLARIWC